MRQFLKHFLLSIFIGLFAGKSSMAKDKDPKTTSNYETAVFAGGCFWCMEEVYQSLPGVHSVVSGYTGGHIDNPTYEQVSAEGTGHKESIQVTYDPDAITYDELLDLFWRNVDPFDDKGQFCDKGDSYRAVIFVTSEQEKSARASKTNVETMLGKSVVTQMLPVSKFYPAEDYHQNYAHKNPIRYNFYRTLCGRDNRLNQVWGKIEKS